MNLALRISKIWKSRTSLLMRDVGMRLGDASNWCMRRARATPKKAPGFTQSSGQIGWRSLLLQLGTHRAMSAVLDTGVLGNDMLRVSRLPKGSRILVIAAHQDDETIGAAGCFILCARAGYEFKIIYYTDGATGFADFDPALTSKLRHDEARKVWRRIAGIEPIFWDYPNRAAQLAADASKKLATVIKKFKPSAIFVPVFFEQPLEHRRMAEVLIRAHDESNLPASAEIWGYQITTRAPGNVVVDITSVWKEKYAINRLWVSQNTYVDYAHLASGRDIANSYFLKGQRHRAASHAELFLVFDAPTYVQIAREFLDLPVKAAILENTEAKSCPPPNFFIIGMQKSGSYWLTALLDLHPSIRCFPSRPGHADGTGEAHLFDLLALMEKDYAKFARSMSRKLDGHFKTILPKKPPCGEIERRELMDRFRTAFNQYCHLQRLRFGKPLVGEKTTEYVHHIELLERMYPHAKKICILRDPRDRLTSFLHHQRRKGRWESNALSREEVDSYIERVRCDYSGLLKTSKPLHIVTYEDMVADPHQVTTGLLHFLGVECNRPIVEAMVDGSSFRKLANRSLSEEDEKSHFRKGVVGDWRNTLDSKEANRIVQELSDLTENLEEQFGLDLSRYRRRGF